MDKYIVRLYRKMIIGVLSVAFALITLTTTTFAWFTLTTRTTVDNLSLSVAAGKDLEISFDGINFKEVLTSEEVKEYIGNQLFLVDVTSSNGFDLYLGGPTIKNVARANRDYLSITIYFRCRTPGQAVYLVDNDGLNRAYGEVHSDLGSYFVSKGVDWRSDARFIYDEVGTEITPNTKKTLYAKDALRVALIEQNLDEEFLGMIDQRVELTQNIYDPSENELRGFGKPYGAISYWNAKHVKQVNIPEDIPITHYSLTAIQANEPTSANSMVTHMIESNVETVGKTLYVGKSTINIWLEGWDADCINAIIKDQIKIQLRFRGARAL